MQLICPVPFDWESPSESVYTHLRGAFSSIRALTEFFMKRFSSVLAILAGFVLATASAAAQSPSQRLELDRKGETIVLEPYAPNILRVTLSLNREPALAGPGYGLIAAPTASGWAASQTAQADVYQSARIVATVDHDLPPAHPPLQSEIDIGKYFGGTTPGAHITLRTPEGKEGLKQELKERINSVLAKGQIARVYFTEFAVQ